MTRDEAARSWPARLAAARTEARRKPPADVEVDTAWTWAARAVARRETAERLEGAGVVACDAWRAHDDALHEALEHAALVRDGGKTLRAVERATKATKKDRRRG